MASLARPASMAASWLWLGYLGAGAMVIGCYYALPGEGGWVTGRAVAYCATSASAAVAVFVGLYRYRPRPWPLWALIGLAQLIYACADAIFCVAYYPQASTTFPGVHDLLYLAHYPVLVAGVLPIARRRVPGGDLPSLLDGLLAATAAATLSYLNLIEPRLDGDLSTLVAVGYPVADLVLFAIAVRLLLGLRRRPPAVALLAASLFALLAADTGYAIQLLGSGSSAGGPLDGIRLAGNLALGAAALHPTMTRVADPAPHSAELGRARLYALYLVGVVAPLTLAANAGKADTYMELVTAGAMVVTMALIMARMRHAEVRQRWLANTDVLTGLRTRRFLETRLVLEAARARRGDAVLALFLIDVDHFKSINDRFGHPAGDRALTEIARRLRAAARSGDVVARYGGEEFALLAARTGQDDLRAVGERLRATVAAAPVPVTDVTALAVTVSVGGAAAPADAASPAELVDRADRALYAAKTAGRDRVVLSDHPATPVNWPRPPDGPDAPVPTTRGGSRAARDSSRIREAGDLEGPGADPGGRGRGPARS
ncbi:GGDEF domain-containing protein [Frankia nepalensis]|nr:GGDEF domain-containing protein [Frankia nepalensis]